MRHICIIVLVAAASLTGCFEYLNELFTEVDRRWIFRLADTGQSTCYDASGGVIACDDGGNYPRQDGLWTDKPAARNFTGPTLHGASDYTTRDNVTGLVWKTCSEGRSGADCSGGWANLYRWSTGAAAKVCTDLNTGAGYAGRTNWRLPTIHELASLVDFRTIAPSIDTAYFPVTENNTYWSSSVKADDSAIWNVSFSSGVMLPEPKLADRFVRCVADGP